METIGRPFYRFERRRPSPRPGLQLAPLLPEKPVPGIAADVRAHLLARPRRIPSKYFYDEYGSQLYERICATREYYPARTEMSLLDSHAGAIIERTQPRTLLELGSGSSRKTRPLLAACAHQGTYVCYVPIDVCGEMIEQAGAHLLADFEWLAIRGLVGDYSAGLSELPATRSPRLFLFLGGTIGNLTETETHAFLADLRLAMEPGDWLLLGADRVKAIDTLHAAYNDAHGYTAAFNRNILTVLNRQLQADFDIDAFAHEARFNALASRIEMHLRAVRRQRVHLQGLNTELMLAAGERILTEISRKFTVPQLAATLQRAGFSVAEHVEPDDGAFSLVLAQAYGAA